MSQRSTSALTFGESLPLNDLEASGARLAKKLRESDSAIVLTDNGRPAYVIVTVDEYAQLEYLRRFTAAVDEGLADDAAGRLMTTEELKRDLEAEFGPIEWS